MFKQLTWQPCGPDKQLPVPSLQATMVLLRLLVLLFALIVYGEEMVGGGTPIFLWSPDP